MFQTTVVSHNFVNLQAVAGEPTTAQIKRWQTAARAMGLGVAVWERDGADGSAGAGGVALVEVVNSKMQSLATLWEAA